jgi:hypothetical protein
VEVDNDGVLINVFFVSEVDSSMRETTTDPLLLPLATDFEFSKIVMSFTLEGDSSSPPIVRQLFRCPAESRICTVSKTLHVPSWLADTKKEKSWETANLVTGPLCSRGKVLHNKLSILGFHSTGRCLSETI